MKTQLYLAVGLLCVLISCKKNDANEELSKTPPAVPKDLFCDMNGDLKNDFKFNYNWYTYDGIGISGDGIGGNITPMNDNQVLYSQDHGSLFLKETDTISITDKQFVKWSYSPASLVSVSTTNDNYWPTAWRILGDTQQGYKYIGVKVANNNSYSVGWIKISINTASGDITILDKKLKTADYIIVDK
jgi:hypothetical protein